MNRLGRAVLAALVAASAFAASAPGVGAASPVVFTMVIGATPYSINSITTVGTPPAQTITVVLPLGESQPLFDESAQVKGGNISAVFPTVDFYTSTNGGGVEDEIGHAYVSEISASPLPATAPTATARFAFETITVKCSGLDAVCAPSALPQLSLASSVDPSDLAQQTTFTAARAVYPGGPIDTGTVAFSSDGTLIPGCESVSMTGGQADCVTSFAMSGQHDIKASDTGDKHYIAAAATLTQTVNAGGVVVVTVSGSQTQGSSTPAFTAADTPPAGVSVVGDVTCTGLAGNVAVSPSLSPGSYGIDPTTCSGLSLSGAAAGFTLAYAGATFTVVPDTTPPLIALVSRTPANANGWNNTPVVLVWSCSDPETGVVAAAITTTVSSEGAGQTAGGTCQDGAGNTSTDTQSGINIDLTPPTIALLSRTPANANGWNNTAVTLVWSCSDALSGAVNATTTQTVATEGANQNATGVCADNAGNSAADTQGGISIDQTPPNVSITSPAAGSTFLVGQAVPVSFACADNAAGSGIASCAGTQPNGAALDTSSTGTQSFTVTATDLAGNVTSQTISYSVSYQICLLYDPSKAVQQGSTIPVKIEICDANGNDLSSAAITVRATGMVLVSINSSATLQFSGSANPDSDFRFDSTLGPTGGYIFNLSTKPLATGIYAMQFTVGSDPAVHSVEIQVR